MLSFSLASVEYADVPANWTITPEQDAFKPFPEVNRSLALLDTAELLTWLDYNQIDSDPRLAA